MNCIKTFVLTNPCPCGFYPDRNRCHCSEREVRHYQNKISGPIRDRIDDVLSCGCNRLISQGAGILTGISEFSKELKGLQENQKQYAVKEPIVCFV